ncbi:hypothetical protein HN747_05075 [archaeon]|jgi:hypothetical protein|nr:hypothetical protein [archaeon]
MPQYNDSLNIITRQEKGFPLTIQELDSNFTGLAEYISSAGFEQIITDYLEGEGIIDQIYTEMKNILPDSATSGIDFTWNDQDEELDIAVNMVEIFDRTIIERTDTFTDTLLLLYDPNADPGDEIQTVAPSSIGVTELSALDDTDITDYSEANLLIGDGVSAYAQKALTGDVTLSLVGEDLQAQVVQLSNPLADDSVFLWNSNIDQWAMAVQAQDDTPAYSYLPVVGFYSRNNAPTSNELGSGPGSLYYDKINETAWINVV